MTETQKRFLTSYLGECWIEHDNPDQLIYSRQVYIDKSTLVNRTFTTAQDKQYLLEALMANGEWDNFLNIAYQEYSREFPLVDGERITMSSLESRFHHYYKWLILLPSEEVAELICKWKEVE